MSKKNHSYADTILTKQTTRQHSYLTIFINFTFSCSLFTRLNRYSKARGMTPRS